MLQKYALIRHMHWTVLVCTGRLEGFGANGACLKARAFRAVSFSLATTPAATSLRKTLFFKILLSFTGNQS